MSRLRNFRQRQFYEVTFARIYGEAAVSLDAAAKLKKNGALRRQARREVRTKQGVLL